MTTVEFLSSSQPALVHLWFLLCGKVSPLTIKKKAGSYYSTLTFLQEDKDLNLSRHRDALVGWNRNGANEPRPSPSASSHSSRVAPRRRTSRAANRRTRRLRCIAEPLISPEGASSRHHCWPKLTWQKLHGAGSGVWVWMLCVCSNVSLFAAPGAAIRRDELAPSDVQHNELRLCETSAHGLWFLLMCKLRPLKKYIIAPFCPLTNELALISSSKSRM